MRRGRDEVGGRVATRSSEGETGGPRLRAAEEHKRNECTQEDGTLTMRVVLRSLMMNGRNNGKKQMVRFSSSPACRASPIRRPQSLHTHA